MRKRALLGISAKTQVKEEILYMGRRTVQGPGSRQIYFINEILWSNFGVTVDPQGVINR